MDIHEIRNQLRTKTIYDIPMRVTFYARVSSESDEQLNSLGNQIQYYENLIKKNETWTFVSGYIDEGISGISTKKRENFHRMIDDAKAGEFDFVITKEISRFARNTLDSITYTRELLNNGVGVFFQNDGINTLDEDSELRLTIMSGIAQDELRKLSSRIKFGHQQAIKNNVVLGNSRIFGYVKNDKKLEIDEDQAIMVREIFELYASDEYSLKNIEQILWDKGYRNHNGNKIKHSTLGNIISNPKYKGYYVGNKVKVVDMFTKKQKFLPPDEWVMFKDETGDIVPAIVSEEMWDRANEVLARRSEDVKNRQGIANHNNTFTGKIICTHCGKPYYKKAAKGRDGTLNNKWVCSGKISNGAESCPSFTIYENELMDIIASTLSETQVDSKKMIDEYMRIYAQLNQSGEIEKLVQKQKKIIEDAEKKKNKLLDYNVAGKISDDDFIKMNQHCQDEIEQAQAELFDLKSQQENDDEFSNFVKRSVKIMEKAERIAKGEMIDREFVDEYINKIYVTPTDSEANLEIELYTGEITSRRMENFRGCMGQMSKKMIQAYENGMK